MSNFLPQLSGVGSFLLLVLGFGFVIFVHELGHFLAAKFVGIKVTQFAIGFGPAVVAWRKGIGLRFGSTEKEFKQKIDDALAKETAERQAGPVEDKDKASAESPMTIAQFDAKVRQLGLGETEYRWNWVPLGGYVKMLGQEDANPGAQSNDPRSYTRKSAGARALVISAGVIMNLIFGVIFFVIAFMNGVKFNSPIVGPVAPDAPAAKVYAKGHENNPEYKGLKPADEILAIDGTPVTDNGDFRVRVALSSPNRPVTVDVARPKPDGTKERLTYLITPTKDPGMGLLSIGVGPASSLQIGVKPDTIPAPLTAAGVQYLMTATTVDGQPVKSFFDYERRLEQAEGKPLPVTFTDEKGATATVSLSAKPTLTTHKVAGATEADDVYFVHMLGFTPVTEVREVSKGEPADEAGLKAGDVIVRINNRLWPYFADVSPEVKASDGRAIELEVLRNGERVKLQPIKPNRRGQLGIALEPATGSTVISQTLHGMSTSSLNLNAGSRITSIDGQRVDNFADVQRAVTAAVQAARAETQPTSVSMRLGFVLNSPGAVEEEAVIALDAAMLSELAEARWTAPHTDAFALDMVTIKANNPIDAAKIGVTKTWQFMVQTWLTVGRVAQGTVPLKNMSGIVGIADSGTRLTKQFGWPSLLWFLGLISANLAVINFLPIPVVDGGLMTMLIIEKIKGSPINPKIQEAITYVGLALLLSLMVFVTYHDVVRLFT